MEQEQKALQERIGNGEDVTVDNPTDDGDASVIEMNVGIVADNTDSGDWTEDSGEHGHLGCVVLNED